MTNLLDHRLAGSTHIAMWTSPDRGLWVASSADTYLGLIKHGGGSYLASDSRGRELGRFDTLAEAKTAIERVDEDVAPRPSQLARVAVTVFLLVSAAAVAATGVMAVTV